MHIQSAYVHTRSTSCGVHTPNPLKTYQSNLWTLSTPTSLLSCLHSYYPSSPFRVLLIKPTYLPLYPTTTSHLTCLLNILTRLKNACSTLTFSAELVSTIGTFWTFAKYIISSKWRERPLSHLVATSTTGTSIRSSSSNTNLYWVPACRSFTWSNEQGIIRATIAQKTGN